MDIMGRWINVASNNPEVLVCLMERRGACAAVCPTGAIISTPEANMKMGTARLDDRRRIPRAIVVYIGGTEA